ncbi:MAG TPA: hypothetical protein VFU15_09210 [Bacteroidia bacterium]|nr:hypothetical protein [Bacteroidia bacterium]
MKSAPALLAFFVLLQFSLRAQDTTHVTTHYHNGKVNEQFTQNKKGDKEGNYLRYSTHGKTLVTGQYKDGVPVGVWNYYSSDTSGTLVDRLDFDTHKELFVDSLRVPQLICGPRYFGGNLAKNEYIAHRIRTDFTPNEIAPYHGQSFTVTFAIDTTTMKPVMPVLDESGLPSSVVEKMKQIVLDMPAWLPPVCKDKNEVWQFSVVFTF